VIEVPRPLRELTPELSPAHRLGAELRAFRLKAGHTQKSLGREVSVSNTLIASIESGDRISSVEVIGACDKELGAAGALLALWRPADLARRRAGRPASRAPRGQGAEEPWQSSPMERAFLHVERAFDVRLDRDGLTLGSQSVGARTNRGTWVRLQGCPAGQVGWQAWNGTEAVLLLEGVAAPRWFNAATWRDDASEVLWRADETALVTDPPVSKSSFLRADPELSEAWWRDWSTSLDALERHGCARIAIVDGQPVTESHIVRVAASVWPRLVSGSIAEWSSAHGAMTWAKLTSPGCRIINWTRWGRAPRGLDAATLWSFSLAVPHLAARIWATRRTELESPTGTMVALYSLARILTDPATSAGPLAAPARHAAARLLQPSTLIAA
jgi:transcriptional regulator with XRE-family HTH domain